jgi:hypothetical protein
MILFFRQDIFLPDQERKLRLDVAPRKERPEWSEDEDSFLSATAPLTTGLFPDASV